MPPSTPLHRPSLRIALALSTLTALLAWPGPSSARVRITERSERSLKLEVTLPSVDLQEISTPSGRFLVATLPEGQESGRPGEPALPICTQLLALPPGGEIRIEGTRVEFGDPIDLRGRRLRPVSPAEEEELACDPDAYTQEGWGDAPLVRAGEPAILRGTRVVPLILSPVQYDPAGFALRSARRLEVDLRIVGGTDCSEKQGTDRDRLRTPSFARLYDALLVDDGAKSIAPATPGTWLLICPDNPDVTSRLAPLVEWRKRKGYPVVVANTSETGGTKEQIKAYIQNAYDTWPNPPEFVVLAGDCLGAFVIPTWNENASSYQGEGDHPYVLLDGDDILADAHVGRLSFQSLDELETIVSKITNYERQPYMEDTSWFTRTCLTGDPIQSGISTVHTMQWIKSRLQELSYTEIDSVFSGPWVSKMTTALNRGDSIFAYRGIYGMSGWSNGNTQTLTNGWKLPYCVVITCDTGSFQYGTSRSETFLRAGTPTEPKGGVGCVGTATTGTHTRYNNCYMVGNFWGLLYQDAWEMGAAHTAGKLNLWTNYWSFDYGAVVRFSYWNNLMGDPATEVWTAAPQPITATHPAMIALGSNVFPIDVQSNGEPCAGALVCVHQGGPDEVQATGYTDDRGHLDLPLPGLSGGPVQLTVTKHDHLPYLADVDAAAGEHIGLQAFLLDDDALDGSQGNDDGLASPAETIALRVQLHNFGTQPATAGTARLEAADPDVPVTADVSPFGSLAPGASVWGESDFVFRVPAWAGHGRSLRFRLLVTSGAEAWESAFEIPVAAPELRVESLPVEDSGANGRLDPGESGNLVVQLQNGGGIATTPANGTLFSLSRYVDVLDAAGVYPGIAGGSSGSNEPDPFVVAARSDCPAGYSAPMMLMVETVDGSQFSVHFGLPIGELNAFDPMGPDRYGYWAFDDTDTGYPEAPVYNWREIAPAAGGPGTQVTLGDLADGQDKSRTVELPFPFTYYGETYTTATICSNGWIQMGATWLTDYRNWELPSPGGPNGAIAVYWDELIEVNTTNAHVYQYYDADEHCWIVEWYRMKNGANSSVTETFEAILYDPAWHPTETGDGIIVFQYQNITNVDYLDGYSTVGIEKPDNTDGLTYVYALHYTESCAPLVSGRAFKFITRREAAAGVDGQAPASSQFGFQPESPNPLSAGGNLRFSLATGGETVLALYDAQGRMVRELLRGLRAAGEQEIAWDGCDDRGRVLPAGLYFARLESTGRVQTRKLTLWR